MAIHDQNYVRYDGVLKENGAWWVIARTSFLTYLSFLRTKLVILALWAMGPGIALVLIILEYAVSGQVARFTEPSPPSGSYVAYFLQVQAFSLAVLFAASGCGVISEDLRFRTFQLYFSKPLSRPDYAIGKSLGLFMLGSLVSVIPAVVVGTMRTAFFYQNDYFKDVLQQSAIGIGLSAAITAVITGIVVGLSALTPRTGYVVLSWIGVIFVPLIMSGIVAVATGGADWALLWSLTGAFHVVAEHLLTPDKAFEGPIWVAYAVPVLAAGVGIGLMVRRISRLEGVA